MKQGAKITKEQANQIIGDWAKANRPKESIVCCYKGQWYDLRDLTSHEKIAFLESLAGVPINQKTAANIEINVEKGQA